MAYDVGQNPDEYLMLSGIQHYFFCKRQWYLIHVEQFWKENMLTAEGKILHEKVDKPFIKEKRSDVFYSRAMPVISHRLRFVGILDLVEFTKTEDGVSLKGKEGLWRPVVVEYKRGTQKNMPYDEMQLTAEVMALEETLDVEIKKSFLYYHQIRRRISIDITNEKREAVLKAAEEMMSYFLDGKPFDAVNYKNCTKCSLVEYCLPRITKKRRNIDNYLKRYCYEKT